MRTVDEIFATPKMVVDGKVVETEAGFDVLNPATGKSIVRCPSCSEEQVRQAVEVAHARFEGHETTFAERVEWIKSMAELLKQHRERFAELICKEQGKPKGGETTERAHVGASGEVGMCIAQLNRVASMTVEDEEITKTPTHTVVLHRRPVGVVAAITPWNFPLAMCVQKLAPAVLLGNTFIAKPSPFTPLSVLAFVELIQAFLPPGVVNSVVSDDRVLNSGAVLTGHPLVSKISFTGSAKTGKIIMGACANDMKRLTLEMGGNDAAIVLKDCDVKKAAKGVFTGAFANTGQVCVAIKRAFVHEDIHDEFVKELVCLAKEAKFGDGLKATTQYGPLNNMMQYKIVESLVEDAKSKGATIECGGKRYDLGDEATKDGFFYEPTVVSDIREGALLVDQEQFGPALPVIKYSDEADAVKRANDTSFGLGGSVWSSDIKRANTLATKLVAGTVWVNEHMGPCPGAPFGGFKHSGLGRERGCADLGNYTEMQTLKIANES